MSSTGDTIRDAYAILNAMALDDDPNGLSRQVIEEALAGADPYELLRSMASTALLFAQIIANEDERELPDLIAEFGMSAAESLAEGEE